jgi:hypothetical protein
MGYIVNNKCGDVGLDAEAGGAGAVDRKRVLALVHVGGWAGRYIFVDRRLLLVPSDAHPRTLSEAEVELGTEDTRSTRGSSLVELLERCPFLGDDHLDDKVVLDAHAILAIHVAQRLESDVAGGVELDVDFAALKVSLPPSLNFLVGNGTNVLMKNALAFTANLLDVLGASWSNELLRFLNAPVEFAQPPSRLRIGLVLDDTRQAHLNRKVTNGVNDRRQLDGSCEIGRREDADRVLLVSGEDGALDVDAAPVGDLVAIGCGSDRREVVVQGGEAAMGGGGQVARQQMAEGEAVRPVTERCGVRQELPFVDLSSLVAAVGAVLGDWLLSRDDGKEAHLELVDADKGLVDVHHQLARENGAR